MSGPLVAKQGELSLELGRKLMSTGGEQERKRVLLGRGYSEEETLVIPVMLWDQERRKLKGTMWTMHGPNLEMAVKATDMWENLMLGDREVILSLTFELRKFRFESAGEKRTNSQWLGIDEAESVLCQWEDTGVELTEQDMEGSGLNNKNLAVRAQIHLSSMSQALIYMGMAPVAPARLSEIGRMWGMTPEEGRWPVRVVLWTKQNRAGECQQIDNGTTPNINNMIMLQRRATEEAK